MVPNKKELLSALKLTFRAYNFPRGTEKSIEWEMCVAYKGDCSQCIWSVYGKPDVKTGKFPCQQRPLPPVDPNKVSMVNATLRYLLYRELYQFFKDMHYSHVLHKTDYFKTMFKKTVRNVSRRKR